MSKRETQLHLAAPNCIGLLPKPRALVRFRSGAFPPSLAQSDRPHFEGARNLERLPGVVDRPWARRSSETFFRATA
jgi:hypothetical protein